MPIPKSGYSLKNLSAEHTAAMDSFLLADHSVDRLVKIIKEEWGQFPGITDSALRRMLYRYKARHIRPKQAKLAAKHTTDAGLHALVTQIQELEDRLDPVLSLEKLVLLQQSRVEKLAKTEQKAPALLDMQTKNIGLLGDLLLKLVNTQLEVGLLTRVPKKLKVAAIDVSDEEREFIESSRLADQKAAFLVEAFRMLKEDNIVDVPGNVVDERSGTQS